MTPVTIRYSILLRVQGIVLCLVPAAAIVFLVWISSSLTGLLSIPFPLSLLGIGMGLFILLIVSVFLTGLGLLAVRAAQYLSFRMEFLENSFRINSFSWSGKKAAEYPYADVLHIGRGPLRGTVDIHLAGAEPIRLTPFLYEGKGEKLFSELEQRFPAGKVEKDLKGSVLKINKWDFITYPIMFGILAGILIMTWQSAGLDFVRSNSTWTNAVPWSLGNFYNAVSTAEEGTVWYASHSLDDKTAQVGRLQGGSTRKWDVPSNAFTGGENARDIVGVGGTSDGNPVLITENSFLTWSGTEWNRIPLPAEILNYLGYSISMHSLQYLSAKGAEDQFWSCDFDQRACRQLAAPEALKVPGVWAFLYRGFSSGPVTAISDTDGPVLFFRFQQGAWKEIALPLDIPERTLLALTVDRDGTLWVTRNLSLDTVVGGYVKGPLAFGRWDAADGEWRWSALDAFPASFEIDVENMEVDPRGRIWIAGHYRTEEVLIGEMAGAYSIQGEQAVEIVRYTDENSNFQMGVSNCPMVQGPDGKLWSCGSGLVSFDAGAEKLPEPVYSQLVVLGSLPFRMFGLGIVCILEIVYFAIVGILYLRRKKSYSGKINQ